MLWVLEVTCEVLVACILSALTVLGLGADGRDLMNCSTTSPPPTDLALSYSTGMHETQRGT